MRDMRDMNLTISPDDHMMTTPDPVAYFRTSRSALDCVLRGLASAGKVPSDVGAVLDFGSGYGRVYRALAAAFPDAKLTACDLMESASRFCAETFGGDWVKSDEDLAAVKLPRKYDLIWLGSVFTHLPIHRWQSLLGFLADATNQAGVVVFTSHGERAIKQIEDVLLKRNPFAIESDWYAAMKAGLPQAGFDFYPSRPAVVKHQVDRGIDVSQGEYGFSFTTEEWVRQFVSTIPQWNLVAYEAAGWGGNHDVVTLLRV